ncbi:Crp/Fnr family transcriptional regulator [Pseudomarimonas arenosa]|uniref:Crp/Fnr family transcriptional regulator n=1 Tax=Pseudomarimonas arenosa TaxID=2774145 RepID=A0AAW3ZTJ2_9GAMM|nr:Crp/Fnr family transcriptional regulator [Pseudomarimonas arenosa]MBD8527441.1 Crp/Fnr family transcriptional regulator [Pseudomarimonas arenosa]
MATTESQNAPNQLIEALPSGVREQLRRCGETVVLEVDQVLCTEGHPYTHVYFPTGSVVSQMVTLRGHASFDVSMIGCEGMLGASLVLDVIEAPWLAKVEGAGSAVRIAAGDLCRLLEAHQGLRRPLGRYLFNSYQKLGLSACCARFHEIEPRLAGYLLSTADRVPGGSFQRTHQTLADMLGVQRSAVTIAAGALQRRGLIRYSRGEIQILNRPALVSAACECYRR